MSRSPVRNTAEVAGDEVAELYLGYPPSASAPLHALKGFKRVHLAPGEAQHITFTLEPRDLSQVTEQGEHVILPGSHTVFVGGNQPADGASGVRATFEILGEEKLPR